MKGEGGRAMDMGAHASRGRRRCLNINKQLHDIIRGNRVGVYRGRLVKKSERSPACPGLL